MILYGLVDLSLILKFNDRRYKHVVFCDSLQEFSQNCTESGNRIHLISQLIHLGWPQGQLKFQVYFFATKFETPIYKWTSSLLHPTVVECLRHCTALHDRMFTGNGSAGESFH